MIGDIILWAVVIFIWMNLLVFPYIRRALAKRAERREETFSNAVKAAAKPALAEHKEDDLAADLHRWDALNAVMAVPADAPEWLKPQEDGTYGTPPFEPDPEPPKLPRPALNMHDNDRLIRHHDAELRLMQQLAKLDVEMAGHQAKLTDIGKEMDGLIRRDRAVVGAPGRFTKRSLPQPGERPEPQVGINRFGMLHLGDHVQDDYGHRGRIERFTRDGWAHIRPDGSRNGLLYRRLSEVHLAPEQVKLCAMCRAQPVHGGDSLCDACRVTNLDTLLSAPVSKLTTEQKRLRNVAVDIARSARMLSVRTGKSYQECLSTATADYRWREEQKRKIEAAKQEMPRCPYCNVTVTKAADLRRDGTLCYNCTMAWLTNPRAKALINDRAPLGLLNSLALDDYHHRSHRSALTTPPQVEDRNWEYDDFEPVHDQDTEIVDPVPASLFHVGDHVITSAQQAGVITKINRGAEEAEVRYVGTKTRMWWAFNSLRHDDIPS